MQKSQNRVKMTTNQKKYAILVVLISCLAVVQACIYRINSTKKYDESLYKDVLSEYEEIYSADNTENLNSNNELNEIALNYIKNKNVIGKLEIPKLNLNTPILYETTDELMKIAPTKYSGTVLNGIGNVVIIGHNYYDGTHFSDLNKLVKGDEVKITDLYDNKCSYVVYEKEVIKPNDFSCLSEDKTNMKSFVTLITCINGIKNRLVVKCVEKN